MTLASYLATANHSQTTIANQDWLWGCTMSIFRRKKVPAAVQDQAPAVEDQAPAEPKREESAWTPVNPQFASHMPLSNLEQVFIFTDGDGQALARPAGQRLAIGSTAAAGVLQDTAEAPLKDILDVLVRVSFNVIAHSGVPDLAQRMGQLPEPAWAAISKIDPIMVEKAQAGIYRNVVRAVADPLSGEQMLLLLVYRPMTSERTVELVRRVEPVVRSGRDDEAAFSELQERRDIDGLVALLEHPDQRLAAGAAAILGRLGGAQAVRPLIAELKRTSPPRWGVFYAALDALGQLGDREAVSPLLLALDQSPNRRVVIEALGKLGDGRAVVPLLRVLSEEEGNPVERSYAIEALGRIGDRRAVPVLAPLLADERSNVRNPAERALEAIGGPEADDALARYRADVAERHEELKAELGVGGLIEALQSENPDLRIEAMRALRETGPDAVDQLIGAIGYRNWDVRWRAAFILGGLGDRRAVEPLIRALTDPDVEVRTYAAEALGKLKDPAALEPLIAALQDEGRYVREGVAEALGKIEDPIAVKPLITALDDPDDGVREKAARALETIGSPEAKQALAEHS
jgi:HEAT repeat protein